ncbi:hypothetical protein V6N13_010189 [Hibiscus sabdariffa]
MRRRNDGKGLDKGDRTTAITHQRINSNNTRGHDGGSTTTKVERFSMAPAHGRRQRASSVRLGCNRETKRNSVVAVMTLTNGVGATTRAWWVGLERKEVIEKEGAIHG